MVGLAYLMISIACGRLLEVGGGLLLLVLRDLGC